MSSIDERIVQMKFDNGQFQKGATETIATMEELKRNFMLDGMANGIDSIASKFNAFGAIGFTVLQTLTNAAMKFGGDIAGAILDPLVEGGKKRALNIEQAKFQFKGLKMDVEATMADALFAVQGTAFGLDEAAVAAAQFGASGVQSGADMQAALRGISGVAAMAGASYTDVASIFTKVAGQGRLMGDDLNRLGSRGINAAATLAKAMGTTEEAVRKMVTEGKISFETFSQVMSAEFGDHATKANETYTGSLSNMRAAIARIGASFATVDFESQRRMFNSMTPAIDNVAKAIKPVLSLFEEIKTQSTDNFVAIFDALNTIEPLPPGVAKEAAGLPPIFQAIQNALQAVINIIRPIRDAFNEVFPPSLAGNVMAIAQALRDFTSKLVLSESAVEKVKGFFVSFFTAIKMGLNVIGGIASVFGNLVRVAWELGGALLGLISPVVTFVKNLFPVSKGLTDSSEAIQGFFGWINTLINFITGPLIAGLRGAGAGFDGFLNGGEIQKRIQSIMEWIGKLIGSVGAMYKALFKGDTSGGGFFGSDNKFLNLLSTIRDVIMDLAKRSADFFTGGAKGVGDFFKTVGEGIAAAFKGLDIDWNLILATLNTGLLGALAVGLFGSIKKMLGAFSDFKSIKDSFAGILDSVGGALDRFNAQVKPNWADQMIKIGVALLILAGAIAIMSSINPDRMVSSLAGLGGAMAVMIGTMFALDKLDLQPSIKASIAMSLLAFAINIMASALVKMGELSWDELQRGLVGLVLAMMTLVVAAQNMAKYEKDMIKSAFAMLVMTLAIYSLAGAVAIFGVMPLDMLIQGGIAVATALGILVGAAVLLSKFAPKMVLSAVGLMAMAAALNMLLIPITALGLMPIELLIQGFTALMVILGGMVLLSVVLGNAAPKMLMAAAGLLLMAIAINLLVIPILALGMMDFGVLLQGLLGLAAALVILVLAANMIQQAIPGVAGMVLMAAAVMLLALALQVLGSIPIEGLVMGLIAIVVLFGVLIAAGALAALVIPGLLALAGAVVLVGLGLIVMAASVVIFAIGLAMLGPALMSVLGTLVMFSDKADVLVGMAGPLALLGASLLALGVGALVAGVGVLLLGTGLVVLAAGLLLIALTGVIGLVALTAVINGMMKLMDHVPGMLILAGTFALLGASILVLGAGLLLLAAGALLFGVALLILVPLGGLVALSVEVLLKAIEKAANKADKITALVTALTPLGKVLEKLGKGAASAVVSVVAIGVAFTALTIGALLVGGAVTTMVAMVTANVPRAVAMTLVVAGAFGTMVATMLNTVMLLQQGLLAATPIIILASTSMALALTSNTARVITGSYGVMYGAGSLIGTAIIDGMRFGLQNGSNKVSQAAASVANNALKASRKELGVNSPSKEYYEIGDFMDQGMADGQLDNVHKVTSASEQVGKAAIAAMRDSLAMAKNAIASDMSLQPTIRPVLDMSGVTKGVGQLGSMFNNAPTLRLDNSRALASSTSAAINQTADDRELVGVGADSTTVNYTQNNYSPKALPEGEIYRNTRSLIPRIKEELDK